MNYDKLVSVLTGKVNENWGKKETKLPSRTSYIKYTQNYKAARSSISTPAALPSKP